MEKELQRRGRERKREKLDSQKGRERNRGRKNRGEI